MPRSSAQSDFVFAPAPVEDEDAGLPDAARIVSLPRATWRTRFASRRATYLVYAFVGITLFLLLLMTMIGPHIPSGE